MIIALGGPSNAGKSGLASLLKQKLINPNTAILCQDDFVYPKDHLPRIRDRIDWESPDTINKEAFMQALEREHGKQDVVIVEGFLIYAFAEMNMLFNKKLFLKLDKSTFLDRKKNDHRWGIEPAWYVEHIWDSYVKYGQAPAGPDVLTLDGSRPWPVNRILNFIGRV